MKNIPFAKGVIKSSTGEYPVAGIEIRALFSTSLTELPGALFSTPLKIGQATSGANGSFEIPASENSEIQKHLCLLEHCASAGIIFQCMDSNGAALLMTEPIPLEDIQYLEFKIPITQHKLHTRDWKEFSYLIKQTRTLRLGSIAEELTVLTPASIFSHWPAMKRLAILSDLEKAILDPKKLLLRAEHSMQISTLRQPAFIEFLQNQFVANNREDLMEALDIALLRLNLLGGHLYAADILLSPEEFEVGDVIKGVNNYITDNSIAVFEGNVASVNTYLLWSRSTLSDYRDYLVDIWVQRAVKPSIGNLDKTGAQQQLNNRFHQNFRTLDIDVQPANKLLAFIVKDILVASGGSGFGFGISTASIETQGDRSPREYLDYLITLSGLNLQELENRYRLNLSRSDLEYSNLVQLNIDTLQRFFTDSFQSVLDESPIFPPAEGFPPAEVAKPIIYESTFVETTRPHGPFFWQYEEWVDRNAPFYAENYYDLRSTFHCDISTVKRGTQPSERENIFNNSISVEDFVKLAQKERKKYIPNIEYDTAKDKIIGDQWARNLIEVQDLLLEANQYFNDKFYEEAISKYKKIANYVNELLSMLKFWGGTSWDFYDPIGLTTYMQSFKINDFETLDIFERMQWLNLNPSQGGSGGVGWQVDWYNGGFEGVPNKKNRSLLRFLFELINYKIIPYCLSEIKLAQGFYQQSANLLDELAMFIVSTGPAPNETTAKIDKDVWWRQSGIYENCSLPYATDTAASASRRIKRQVPNASTQPSNMMEKKFFRLKLGKVLLEWADSLYRTDKPASIARARELYKGVLFLHGEDPHISPNWDQFTMFIGDGDKPVVPRNPAVNVQVNQARIGFMQISAGLNYYGCTNEFVPPVRYRVLKEAAERFAQSAKSAQADYLGYMQRFEQSLLDEFAANHILEQASSAILIAKERIQIAQYHVDESQKQVEKIKEQIAEKEQEMAEADSFWGQVKDFFGGIKDSVSNLIKTNTKKVGAENDDPSRTIKVEDIGGLIEAKSVADLTTKASAYGSGAALGAAFGGFIYTGISAMYSLGAASAKRVKELNDLKNVVLPASLKLLEVKKRDVTIAGLQEKIAQEDHDYARKLLAFYSYRYHNKAFWQNLSDFANRLMRRYLDMGSQTAWLAEKALSFEQDRPLHIISFDYFPKHLRGVTGADLLQLHLAELEAARIFGLSQTIPVKQSVSLARDFPIAFGQLKKYGVCRFNTSELPLKLVFPGVYGYRLRCLTISPIYTQPTAPPRGILTNNGISLLSGNQSDTLHVLHRYPDALPISEFRMYNDMWIYDMPDETLLPFEGSGFETEWELKFPPLGNMQYLGGLTDLLLTFDMRAKYSAILEKEHSLQLPTVLYKSLLLSAAAQNPKYVSQFKIDGTALKVNFNPLPVIKNEPGSLRLITNIAVLVVGIDEGTIIANLSGVEFEIENGMGLSNSGFLAAANGAIPLPLNDFFEKSVDQIFALTIDVDLNPSIDFSGLADVLLFVEYEIQL